MKTASSRRLPSAVNPAWRIGIVHSAYYKVEMEALVSGARIALESAGIFPSSIGEWEAPGSFEVPLIGAALAEAHEVDALIGLGIIIEGETHHAGLLAEQAARGIMDVQLKYRIPFAFEILHVASLDQARERARPGSNKGEEAAYAVLHSLESLKRIRGT
jgi:6,7-dimethyl-8-ribityllumazine synthase